MSSSWRSCNSLNYGSQFACYFLNPLSITTVIHLITDCRLTRENKIKSHESNWQKHNKFSMHTAEERKNMTFMIANR
jgi:hypothetical protein